MSDDFTHLDRYGHATMVDVTGKASTVRRAETRCVVAGLDHSAARLRGVADAGLDGSSDEVLWVARIAGLQAGKLTSTLIPLCHPLPLTDLRVEFAVHRDAVEVFAMAETVGQTGVEMEALTACVTAALSVVAAVRDLDPDVHVEDLTLWEKSGGRSGHWRRTAGGSLSAVDERHVDDDSAGR